MTTVGIATGAGRGMGLACAQRLLGSVDTLFVVDRDGATLSDAAGGLTAGPTKVVPVVLDVTDGDALADLATRVRDAGSLRSIAHAAGISPTMADWRRIITVDLVGTALLANAVRPLLTMGTAMVCFASMAAHLGADGRTPATEAATDDPLGADLLDRVREALGPAIEDPGVAYSVAKRGVQRFVCSEAVIWGPLGGRICSVSPGIIDTPQGRQEAESHPIMKTLVDRTPLGREGDAVDVADVVAFLLSDDARFVTGIDLLVDGGICANLASGGLELG